MPTAPDLSGRVIGEYEIQGLLGVGGMGAVYEGRHPVIGKRVAVKVLLPQLSEARAVVERFIDEARAVNAIGHRGIVDIFSFGKLAEGPVYFVMEYLDGKPLDKLIRGQPLMPIPEALETIAEVCDALYAAHSVGIIHRDIKPSNIFVVKNARGQSYVKLLDFGIAKLNARVDEASPQTLEGQALGTPDYMSPEQARGMPISYAADLYSTGCVLFELLTGKRVFKGPNVQRTMFMHAEDPPPVPSSLRPEIPAELDDLVLWMLEKKAEARPKNALEVRAHCLTLRDKLQPVSTPVPSQAAVTPIPPRRSAPTPMPPELLTRAEPPPTAAQRPVRPPAPPEGSRSGASYADLEAGRVVILSRPPDPPPSAPTNNIPVLSPLLSPLPNPAMPPPPPWEGTDRMLHPDSSKELEPIRAAHAPPQIAPAKPSTPPPPPAVGPRTASAVMRPSAPTPAKATPSPPKPAESAPAPLPPLSDLEKTESGAKHHAVAASADPRTEAALPHPLRRERRIKIIGASSLGAVALAGMVWLFSRPPAVKDPPKENPSWPAAVEPARPPQQAVVAIEKPVEVKPLPTPAVPVAPVEPPKPADDPKHDPKNSHPTHPPPTKTGPSIADRLARCEALLSKHEAEKGTDPVLRGFLAQVRAEAANADTDAKRRELNQHLNELQQQLSE